MSLSGLLRFASFMLIAAVFCGATLAQSTVKSSSQKRQPTTDSNDLTAQGVEAFKQGDDTNARLLLERALKSNPNNAETHTFLGILDDKAGDFKNAEIHFAKSARFAPKSASARNNYGAILLRSNCLREAKTEFEASLRLNPQQPNALVNLAQIHFNENTPESLRASAALFERANILTPDAAIARSLIIIALRLNDSPQAAKYYRLYTEHLAKPEAVMPDAANRAELGGALLESKLLNEAETELKAALALDSTNTNATLGLGRLYLMRNDIKSAGRILETAVSQNNVTAPIYSLLAVVYEKSGHYENAIPVMRLAIRLEPKSEKYRYQYGIILTNADAPAAAVIRVNEALKLFPDSSRLWLALGLAHLKSDENKEAVRALNRAIELDPKFAQAYAYLGLVYDQTGQYEEAVKLYERSLQNDSSLAVVHQMIADALLKQTSADDTRIETELRKSIKLDATFVPAYMTLGKLYVRMQRWSDAVVEFEKAAKLDPELVEAYYHLTRVYTRLNRKPEAQAILAKFKILNDSQKAKSEKEIRELTRRLAEVRF